jgi:hypothetical protein
MIGFLSRGFVKVPYLKASSAQLNKSDSLFSLPAITLFRPIAVLCGMTLLCGIFLIFSLNVKNIL